MEILMRFIESPVVWAIIGIIVKTYAPAFIPVLGEGRKLVEELTQAHEKAETKNSDILASVQKEGLQVALKHLSKNLK
jgi:hypothetical protein